MYNSSQLLGTVLQKYHFTCFYLKGITKAVVVQNQDQALFVHDTATIIAGKVGAELLQPHVHTSMFLAVNGIS